MATLYIMESGTGDLKIGISKNPKARLRAMRSHNASEVEIVHVQELGDDAWKVEGHAHRLLKPHHIKGEWFSTSVERALAAISSAVTCVANGESVGRSVGRKKQYEERITLPLSADMLAAIDSSLADGEVRLDLIRAAIERELKKRRSKAPTSKAD
jgi:hypothetical protein